MFDIAVEILCRSAARALGIIISGQLLLPLAAAQSPPQQR